MTMILHGILFLLKWLGIILLLLLGVILLAVVLVLFVPVRYKGRLEKKEAPEEVFWADGTISWLNPFVRVRLRFAQKKFSFSVRLLGLSLIDSEKPKKEKKEKKAKKTRKAKNGTSPGQTAETKERFPVKIHLETDSAGKQTEAESRNETGVPENTGKQAGTGTEAETSEYPEDVVTAKRKSLFVKIKAFFEKVRTIPGKIKEKVSRFIKQVQLLWYKKEKVLIFLQDELHLLALGKAWATLKQVIRHCLPVKLKGQVYFGTGDPESTGKALAGLGILYAAYGKGLTVVPDFNEKHLIATLAFKGRIRMGTLLFKTLKLIRDKQVKRFWKNWKKLLKILKQKVE
ncbi:MAG: hypothetical protein IJZ55_11660 [Lachnospiraceae bacterium]|nr:hypothetical protein [Lachnospiraceae bacterium]